MGSLAPLGAYRTLLVMRRFEEAVGAATAAGEIHGEMHLGLGQEAVAAGLGPHLRPGDAVVSTHRPHLHALARGVDPVEMLAELLERDGLCHGKGGHMHLFDAERDFMCTGIVGASAPIAAGYAYRQQASGGSEVTVAVLGDGAMNQGGFFETANLAAVWGLPMIFLCEDNGFGISVRREDAAAGALEERGAPFGIPGVRCDGIDPMAVSTRSSRPSAGLEENRARRWWWPSAIASAAITRATRTVTAARRRSSSCGHLQHDPVGAAAPAPARRGHRGGRARADRGDRRRGGGRLDRGGAGAPAAGSGGSAPGDVCMTTSATAVGARNTSQLIAETLGSELERDPAVFLLGEDVGRLGGVFGASRALQERFGADRVRDTPISETAFVGLAIGAAQAGLRPVVELMFVDFLGVCFDQILNQMAKNVYMSGATVRMPLVVRTAVGCIGAAAQHSQVLSATFAHVPGLKVVFPSSPGDACRLLRTAIRDDNPVVFLEHKMLLKTKVRDLAWADDAEDRDEPDELGRLRRLREGDDVTIVSAGWMVQESMRASELLAESGVEAGVVDLRTLVPLDRAGLVAVAREARGLLVVDEDYRDYGMCSEIMATVAEELGASRATDGAACARRSDSCQPRS